MNKRDSINRRALLAGISAVGVTITAGCLGDDEVSVPDGSFSIIEEETTDLPNVEGDDQTGSEITVEYSGEDLTTENTHSIELRADSAESFEVWAPGNDPIIDGDTEEFTVEHNIVAPGEEIRFVWMSPDGERESELSTAALP